MTQTLHMILVGLMETMMNKEEPKMVIVMRTDLRNDQGHKVRTGKLISQGSHAALGALLELGRIYEMANAQQSNQGIAAFKRCMIIPLEDKCVNDWVTHRFKKITVGVSGEDELLAIHQEAVKRKLNVKLIKDAGLTEFGGVATYTCLAIGPCYPREVDPVTGHLNLL